MSYEGYEQHICKNGHYFETEPSFSGWFGGDDDLEKCPICKAPSAWENGVDQTNGPGEGEVSFEALKEKFLITPEVIEVCNLGHPHQKSPDVFRVPTREETNPLRQYSQDG